MKSLKWLLGVAIVCLLVGASGAAMAIDCPDGVITGGVGGDIIIDGQDCLIRDADVTGNIEVTGSEDITIVSSRVSGRIFVEQSRFATLIINEVGSIVARNNENAIVVANVVTGGVTVNRNLLASVKQNASLILLCRGNIRLDATLNQAEEENCRGEARF